MVIKAQSPAGFAEEYIIESIWNNRFPPGSILPAERELSEDVYKRQEYVVKSED